MTSLVTINRSVRNPIGRRRDFARLLFLGAVVLGGCRERLSVPTTVPVTGVVKYKGKPLQGIRVTLHSPGEAAKAGFIPTGQTGPDGKFKLSTGAPGNGAPPGTYVVTFDKPEITGNVETEVDAFRGKYSDPAQSKWTVTIEKGETSLQSFELQ